MRLRLLVSVIAIVSLTLSECKVSISFSESTPGTYLKDTQPSHAVLTKDDLITSATSLLNIAALSDVSAETSDKVSSIVQPSPFKKPAAIAAFVIGGAEGMRDLQASTGTHKAEERGSVLEALNTLSKSKAVEHVSLDLSTLSGCGEICLESTLQEALHGLQLDANYTEGTGTLRGILSVSPEAAQQTATVFDLGKAADRLFAIELASTWRAVADATTEQARRRGQDVAAYGKPQLVERVLVGSQALRDAYGAESEQYRTACALTQELVSKSVQALEEAHESKLVTIIAAIPSEEFTAGTSDLVNMIGWASRSQRPARSLLQASNQSSEESYIQGFVAWITMWGIFFLLLFFALSGCHCLKSMKFKQDSLLYGKNKSE